MPLQSAPWPDFERPTQDLVAAFQRISSSDACDAGAEAVMPPLLPYGPKERIAGPLLTAAAATDDNLAVQVAIEWAQPGDVIAVAAVGGHCALVGELVSRRAKERGVRGIAVHGFVRDTDELAVPVYARGTSPVRPARERMGGVAVPLVFGGARLHPGDILICDQDGVALVPLQAAREILDRARQVMARNSAQRREIDAGHEDRHWLREAVRRAGYDTEE